MTKLTNEELKRAADVLRGLSMDAVQNANSGHPGMPMGMADVASVLWLRHLQHCPQQPHWPNRDRFVLSAGHGSVLLYSLLHLAGYDLPMAELRQFRQWDSSTPGHPEFGHTAGVETTTGPLGQGCGNAVGMALAERMLAERFNTDDTALVDHHTYAICGDGDLMEGVSHEAFSLAGHLGLNRLILFYDSNRITIEGSTDLAYSDNVRRRFEGYNWRVLDIDAHDYDEIEKAIRKAKREKTRPTIIICRSHIAYGSPNKQDTHGAHGEPLGEDEVRASKAHLGLPPDEAFHVPADVAEIFAVRSRQLKRKARRWERMLQRYAEDHPAGGRAWQQHWHDTLPEDLYALMPAFDPDASVATRAAGGKVLQKLAAALPQLVGGSADLAPSTKTLIDGVGSVGPRSFAGRNLHFGVREHGMAAVMNGMALHGGLRVFGSTFFVFSDYARPSIRLASIMKLPVVYVFTHDSIFVGEDGPTHQPVEHLASLRCMPGLTLIRPADATETAAAWVAALKNTGGPTALLLSRQKLPVLDRRHYPSADRVERGAYVLWQSGEADPDLILMASGSEVALALEAGQALAAERTVRVVSMPSWELFERQDQVYRETVLPATCERRIAIEAGAGMGWERYVGARGTVLAMNRFGASAPYKTLATELGFSPERVLEAARRLS